MQYKVMRKQTEYVHPSQHTIQGSYNEKTKRIRTSEITYNTR